MYLPSFVRLGHVWCYPQINAYCSTFMQVCTSWIHAYQIRTLFRQLYLLPVAAVEIKHRPPCKCTLAHIGTWHCMGASHWNLSLAQWLSLLQWQFDCWRHCFFSFFHTGTISSSSSLLRSAFGSWNTASGCVLKTSRMHINRGPVLVIAQANKIVRTCSRRIQHTRGGQQVRIFQ